MSLEAGSLVILMGSVASLIGALDAPASQGASITGESWVFFGRFFLPNVYRVCMMDLTRDDLRDGSECCENE